MVLGSSSEILIKTDEMKITTESHSGIWIIGSLHDKIKFVSSQPSLDDSREFLNQIENTTHPTVGAGAQLAPQCKTESDFL